jgi:hypothetical protein
VVVVLVVDTSAYAKEMRRAGHVIGHGVWGVM